MIGTVDRGGALIDRVGDIAIAALSAEAVGAMAALHALTMEYLKTRKQFGVTIGSFQVLQHRAVDMFTALEAGAQHGIFRGHDGDGGGCAGAAGGYFRCKGADQQLGAVHRPVGDPECMAASA
ncbi:MAG: acyl-CoA dehydrogenase family protein [Rhodospirillales bacterium]